MAAEHAMWTTITIGSKVDLEMPTSSSKPLTVNADEKFLTHI